MTPQQFEAAYLAQTCHRLALSDNLDEYLAIASVIRNHVVPKLGQTSKYSSYSSACTDFLVAYPIRECPNLTEDALVSPKGLLSLIESIYDCSYPDLTATQTTPGALYFARTAALDPSDWRWPITHNRPVLATFGAQQFF